MAPAEGQDPRPRGWARYRRLIRYGAAGLCAACAVVYLLIGAGVITATAPAADGSSLLPFGVAAGLAFATGAVLLVAVDRRVLWVLGAVFQALVVIVYVAVSEKRDPPFEAWGIALKVAEVLILGALVYLAVQPRPTGAGPGPGGTRGTMSPA